jgi:hypothetical protein
MPLFSTFGGASGRRFGLTSSTRFQISGGTRTEQIVGGLPYTYFTFTSPGTLTVTGGGSVTGTVLVVRAGAAGVSTGPNAGGNGGAGGAVVETTRSFREGSHAVVRGAAPAGSSSLTIPYGTPVAVSASGASGGSTYGAPGANGTTSTTFFSNPIAYGGGGGAGGAPGSYGGNPAAGTGGTGGAGGGGAGGNSFVINLPSPSWPLINPPFTNPSNDPGINYFYGFPGSPGGSNTGGGGGGGAFYIHTDPTYPAPVGGAGGTGIVVVRFRTTDVAPL